MATKVVMLSLEALAGMSYLLTVLNSVHRSLGLDQESGDTWLPGQMSAAWHEGTQRAAPAASLLRQMLLGKTKEQRTGDLINTQNL